MASNIEDKEKKLWKFFNSEEGKAQLNLWAEKQDIKETLQKKRFRRFTFYLKKHNLDSLMVRLIAEHDKTYQDKLYNRGYEPYPNNKLSFVMAYAKKHGKHVDNVKGITGSDFSESCYYYNGYYFLTICGQGCFHRIFNDKKKMLLQI